MRANKGRPTKREIKRKNLEKKLFRDPRLSLQNNFILLSDCTDESPLSDVLTQTVPVSPRVRILALGNLA